MSRRSFFGGAVILMIAGFIVRILGFIYRIYLSNLIGAEGMGVFQLVVPVYSLIVLTLTSGVSIAVSRMVAAELAKNHQINVRRITKVGLVVVMLAGLVFSVPMYIWRDFIVDVVLKDRRTYFSVMLLIPAIPAIAASSAIKGYFYGMQDVTPTAISQIVEQVVRIGLVLALAGYISSVGLEYACALATVGMAAGELANFIVLFIIYKKRKEKRHSTVGLMRKRFIISQIIITAVPVSFNRFITSILTAIEQILIPRRLLAGGLAYQQSIEEFGRLSGMAMPLIFFPALVTSSLATTLVPAISEAISLNNFRTVNYRISKSIQITFVLGFIFMSIFFAFPNEIGDMVYKKQNIGNMLYYLSFTCIFLYLQQTLLGILNGLGKQWVSLRNSLLGSGIRIAFVYYYVPSYGVKGYVWGIIISSILVCILNIYTIATTTGMTVDIRNWLVKPAVAFVALAVTAKYIMHFYTIFPLGQALITLCTISTCIIEGMLVMVILGVVDKRDILKIIGYKKM